MTKSEKLMSQFDAIVALLENANCRLQKLPVEFINEAVIYEFHNKISNLIEEIEDEQYQVCGCLQIQEDEKLAEIENLEKRISELKSSMQ